MNEKASKLKENPIKITQKALIKIKRKVQLRLQRRTNPDLIWLPLWYKLIETSQGVSDSSLPLLIVIEWLGF